MKEINVCPVCHQTKFKDYLEVEDHFGTKESFQLKQCTSCETLSTNPQPNVEEIIPYYKSNNYISHGDSVNPVFDLAYKTVQRQNLQYKKKLIEKYTLGKNLLDYGCGAGSFPHFMQSKGWQVTGIEPDDSAKNQALSKGIYVIELSNLKREFDCISLFHVLEHVHDLDTTLNKLISHLSKNGVLVLALPNYQSYDAKHYLNHWAGYDVPRHLYHFNQKSMFSLAKRFGLNIVSTHPLKFDSYYVSLLSEKYKNGKSNLFNAFRIGYKSNSKAKRTKEYSSLIYILSK